MPGEIALVVDDRDPAVAIASVTGEIDIASAGALRTNLLRLASAPAVGLVVDLTAVSFVDSSGLNALVAAWTQLDERGGRLVVAAATPLVVRLLEVTGLNQLFTVVSTQAAARALFVNDQG